MERNEYMKQYEKATGLPSVTKLNIDDLNNSPWDSYEAAEWDELSKEVCSEGYIQWLELRAKAINQLFELTDAGMKLRVRGVIDDE